MSSKLSNLFSKAKSFRQIRTSWAKLLAATGVLLLLTGTLGAVVYSQAQSLPNANPTIDTGQSALTSLGLQSTVSLPSIAQTSSSVSQSVGPVLSSQSSSISTSSSSSDDGSLQSFGGELRSRNGNRLTVRDGDNDRSVEVQDSARVTRDTRDASVEDLQVGDRLTVRTRGDRVESIEATSQQVFNTTLWTILGLLLGLLLLGLLIYLLNRANRGHIRTQTTQVNR